MLKKSDSSIAEIKGRVEKTRVCNGTFNGFDWRLVLTYRNGGALSEMPNAPCRFNKDKSNTIAFWIDQKSLDDYLAKRKANNDFTRGGGRRGYEPWSPRTLMQSATTADEFILENVTSAILFEEARFKAEIGVLPDLPTRVPFSPHAVDYHWQVYLKIFWSPE